MKIIFWLGALFAISIIVIAYFFGHRILSPVSESKRLQINTHKFIVKIADTEAKRSQGLSGHKKLADNQGLLFIFPASGIYSFWMKDMTFPLDFVWINNGLVVDITENVPSPATANENLPLYSPRSPVNWVLEINAGRIKNFGIKIGDKVSLK